MSGFENVPEYTVGELSGALRRTLEDAFGLVRVRGEISGFKKHASGHCYFTLKDEHGCLDSVCWRSTAGRIRFKPEDGLEVVASGKVTTYASRSKYQLIVDQMQPAGVGALMALLEERRKKLAAEGLFAPERKRPLPFLPEMIGLVTSPTGAVIRDILHRLAERFPRRVLLWPVLVQGEAAAGQIAAAIEGFNALPPGGPAPRPDVLIVARGGGSLEDLWAFNEEEVVRAAVASAIPLISAVGHETDTTLIDHAADRRAPTPTAAAEIAVPVRLELVQRLQQLDARLLHGIARELRTQAQHLVGLGRGLPDPVSLLGQAARRLDDLADDLPRALAGRIERTRFHVGQLAGKLRRPDEILNDARHRVARQSDRLDLAASRTVREAQVRTAQTAARLTLEPVRRRLPEHRRALGVLDRRGQHAAERRILDAQRHLAALTSRLESVSHENVLRRGFALVRDPEGGLVGNAASAKRQALLELEFHDGRLRAVPGEVRRKAGRPEPPRQARLL